METENTYEDFKIVSNPESTGITVQLPNRWKVDVSDAKSEEQALKAASNWYQTKRDGKDELLFTDLLIEDKNFINLLREEYREQDSSNVLEDWYKEPELLLKKYSRDERFREGNLYYAGLAAAESFGKDEEAKKRRSYLLNTWDSMPAFHQTGGSGFSGLLENIEAGVTDPLTILSVLATPFTGGGSLAANLAAKQGIKKAVTSRLAKQTAIASGIDAAASGGYSYLNQRERVNLGMLNQVNYNDVIKSAAIGAAASTGISVGITGVAKLKPTKAKSEAAKLKNYSRRTIINSEDEPIGKLLKDLKDPVGAAKEYLTTSGRLGKLGAAEARTGAGKQEAFGAEVRNFGNQLKDSILKSVDADPNLSWKDWMQTPENRQFVNNLFDAAYKDFPQVDKSKLPIKPVETEGITQAGKTKKLFYKSKDGKTTLRSEVTPAGEQPSSLGVADYAVMTNQELHAQYLVKNPEIKDLFKKLETSQTSERTGVTSIMVGKSPFKNSDEVHVVRRYAAFEDATENLKRINKTEQGELIRANAVKFIQRSAEKEGESVSDEVANLIVNDLARGKLNTAIEKMKTRSDILGITAKEESDIANISYESLLSDVANVEKVYRSTQKSLLTPVVSKRETIPKEIKEIFGEIDDPITGALEATYRLGTIRRRVETQQNILEALIKTDQVDRLMGDTTILDTTLRELSGKSNITLPSGQRMASKLKQNPALADKTVRQAFADGDISGVDQFKIVADHDDALRLKFFGKTAEDLEEGRILNPYALVVHSKDFAKAERQAMYGASTDLEGKNGLWNNVSQLGYKLNYGASAAKTVYSLATQALNFIGGTTTYAMVNGFQISDPGYIANKYLPMFTEVLRGHINKENSAQLLTKLRNKGYTQEEANDVLQDFYEFLQARIIDSDYLTDFERVLTADGGLMSLAKQAYDNSEKIGVGAFNVKSLNEFTKRMYAGSDEVYKVLFYKNQKKMFLDAGFTSQEAVKLASQDVFDFMPNYRYLPKLIKKLRAVGVGAFVAHTLEITRNIKNVYSKSSSRLVEARRLIKAGEVQKGRALQRDALMRLGRTSAALSAMVYFSEEIGSVLGITEEQSEAERLGLNEISVEFARGAMPLVLEKDDFGNLTVADIHRVFPAGPLTGALSQLPVEAAAGIARGESFEEAYTKAAGRTLYTYLNPALSASPGTEAFIRAIQNSDELGPGELVVEFGENMSKAFIPGVASDIKRGFEAIKKDAGRKALDAYELGPDGKPKAVKLLLQKQLGMRNRNVNIGDSAKRTYETARRSLNSSQAKFSSFFSRAKFAEDLEGDFLTDTNKNFNGIQVNNILSPEARKEFVDTFVEANNERFLLQRELLGKMTAHSNYLKEQKAYKDNNTAVFDEVFKQAMAAKISKATARILVNAAVYPSEPPIYIPFMIDQSNMQKSAESIMRKGISESNAYKIVESLYIDLEKAAQPFYNQRLTVRISDE